jgi:hypothetical protein
LRCFRDSSGGEAVGTERKGTGNRALGVLWNQDEYRICLAPHVLRCLGFLSLQGGSLLNAYVHWDNKSSLAPLSTFPTVPTMTIQIKNNPSEVVVAGDRPSTMLAKGASPSGYPINPNFAFGDSAGVGEMKLTAGAGRRRLTSIRRLEAILNAQDIRRVTKRKL